MKILSIYFKQKSIVSVVYSQSEIASKEVFLFDLLENTNRDYIKHLKCLCFLRPTKKNILDLIRELKNPRYGQYYLCRFFHHNFIFYFIFTLSKRNFAKQKILRIQYKKWMSNLLPKTMNKK